MSKFTTSKNATVKNGYLVFNGNMDQPIFHEDFINLQRRAEYLSTLAAEVKGKKFETEKIESFEELSRKVGEALNLKSQVNYVAEIKDVARPTTDALTKEAVEWEKNMNQKGTNSKINRLMQEFNLLNDFEEVGLYFSSDATVKLEKIYTVKEITEAVTVLEPFLK